MESDLASELERLSKLHNEGSLSDDEFELAKHKLLDQALLGDELKQRDPYGGVIRSYVAFRIALMILGVIIFIIALVLVRSHLQSLLNFNFSN
ncbi:MAG TPA: SHOCT domain-containing protein [Phycisphaerae bacterium]|nr:SHOCT domain-containing protein [Phycisphaerae bacterium]